MPGRHSGDQVHKVKKNVAPLFFLIDCIFRRHNYTVLVSPSVNGRVSTWSKLPAAAPLFAGQAEYSTMAVPSTEHAGMGTFFVVYARGDIYGGKGVLRLTQLCLPKQLN